MSSHQSRESVRVFQRFGLVFGLAGGLWTSLAACGGDNEASIKITIHAPPPLDTTGHCPAGAPLVPIARAADGPTTLRLTYRRHAGALLCDTIVPLEGVRHLVGVPQGVGGAELGPVDLVVEAFRGDATAGAVLVGSGQALDVDLAHDKDVQVMVAPRDQFACAQDYGLRGRAFHSATTLPTGEVVLVGGLVPDPNDATKTEIRLDMPVTGGGFYASASVEIYDPEHATFREVTVPGLTPRAFHQAYLLPTEPGAAPRVLLVGGLAPVGDPAAAPLADGVRDGAEPLRLVPATGAMAAPTEILTLPAEGDGSVARVEGSAAFAPRMFEAATRAPSPGDDPAAPQQTPPLVAGGWETYPTTFANSYQTADLTNAAAQSYAAAIVPAGRVGASATWLAPDHALIWGGNLGSALGNESLEAGDLLTGFGGAAQSALVIFDGAGLQPAARAFHVAVPLAANDLLIVGGFRVAGGSTGEPVSPFAERVRFPAGDVNAVVEVVDAPGALPVGYLEGVPLYGGDALFFGGNPAQGILGSPCPDGTINSALCAVADAWRWRAALQVLVPATPMRSPRWGHRGAVLLDGTVLVTGGFRNQGNKLFVVREAELYNPRTEADDAAAGALEGLSPRAAGDIARKPDGTPFSPCSVTEVAQ